MRERFRNTVNDDTQTTTTAAAAKSKLMNDAQMANNISSPNKQLQAQQQPMASRRTSAVNQASMRQQPSMEYASQNNMMYANKNPVDYNNSLGHNQQFSQPQPPGSSAFSTPQKQQQQFNSIQDNYTTQQPTSNVSIQQAQHNQHYQSGINSSSSHYSSQDHVNNSYSSYQQPSQQQQQQQQQQQSDHQVASSSYSMSDSHTNMNRRGSRQVSESGRPMLGAIHQTSIDHFDHYKRPPSRDSSVDRYTRAASRLGASRQPSVDRQTTLNPATNLTPEITLDRGVRGASQMRGTTPAPTNINGSVLTGMGASVGGMASNNPSRRGSRSGTPVFQPPPQQTLQQIQAHYSSPNQPFEDVILRQRTLGQDIVPSPGQPKRTESLFIPPKPMGGGGGGGGAMAGGGGGGSKGANKVSFPLFFYPMHML
jgi:junctophilin